MEDAGAVQPQRARFKIRPPYHGAARPVGAALELAKFLAIARGPLTSRALREACDGASPTVLQARLSELRQTGFVEHIRSSGYGLTAAGRELLETFLPLHRFAERWRKQKD